MPLSVSSSIEQNYKINIAPATGKGKPSKIEPGSVAVSVNGNGGFTIDGDTGVTLQSEDVGGQSIYTISADADLGAGVVTISDTIEYTYTDVQAASLGLSDGGPVDK